MACASCEPYLAKSTTANSGSDHDDALLCLVTKAACSIDAGWLIDSAVDWFARTGPYGPDAVDEIESLLGCSMLHEHAGKVP